MGSASSCIRLGLGLGLGLALCAGCGQKRSQPAARTATPAVAPPAVAPPAADEDKEKRPRLGETAVYVDGKPVGVLRRQELPAKLPGHVVQVGGGYESTLYSLTEYVTALGFDPKKIRAAHLYGGKRMVVVDRAEFARIGSEIMFSFVQGDRGKPRIEFPPKKLNVNTTIDMLSSMAFYMEKEPPTLNKDDELVMPDGTMVDGKVPYASEEQGNGTRVYVDGNLVGTVKRKKLTNDVAVSGNEKDPTKFSLVGYAGKLNADVKRAKSIDLLAGDDLVAHLAPESAKDVTFYVPSRNRGQALVDVPQGSSADARTQPARISAVQIYVKTTAPTRVVVPLEKAFEAAPSTNAGRGSDDEP